MACTLEELQAVEYEILCKFADFCDDNKLKYVLTYGTLLGAVRHDGFIPWDDDVDVHMSYKDFKKFLKIYKKNPVDGFHLSWFDCERQYPCHMAKLRKDNTCMPEKSVEGLQMHNGVWIDIFMYLGKPESAFKIKIQETLLMLFRLCSEKYLNEAKKKRGDFTYKSSRRFIIVDKCPDKIMTFIRKMLFWFIGFTDCKNSEKVRLFGIDREKNECMTRNYIEPVGEHDFVDRKFYIPENYKDFLTYFYGPDYMTPIKSHIHVELEKIELNLKEGI